MPGADTLDDLRFRLSPTRPLVLLAMNDQALQARFAYQLMAAGFDVADNLPDKGRPDVIVAALEAMPASDGLAVGHASSDRRPAGVPVVAVACDDSASTRDRARREGCAALCLTTCSGAVLAAGIRAVLDGC